MALSHDVILVVYAVATVLGVSVGAVVWRHREKTAAVPLTMILVGTSLFSAPRFVATAVDSYRISVLMEQFLYVGLGLSVVAGVLFALEYTGREHLVTRKTVAALSIEPVLVVVLAFSNPGNVFFESITADPSMPTGIAVEWGIAFGLHTIYSYALLAAVSAMILEFLYTSRSLYRGQALALLGATILPWIANAVHVVGPVEADTTPVGYIVMGVLYAVAIVRYQLIDIVPIARDRVLDTVSEGVFVVDREERLIDVNPAGRAMLDIDSETRLVGRDINVLFADEPAILEVFDDVAVAAGESKELAYDDRYYELQATPITDGRDRHVGWLVLVYDITDRKHREAQLERHNERLDQFASLVSHDLRNPLTTAVGYLELARETDDPSHLEEVERSHERMETIIDDVLTLAREGKSVTEPEPIALETVTDRAWSSVQTDGASLSVTTTATVQADPERTTRLLENLFRNCVEHGSTGSQHTPRADDSVEHGSTSSRPRADDAVEHGSTNGQPESPQETTEDDRSHDATHTQVDAVGQESAATAGEGVTDTLEIEVGPIGEDSLEGFYVADDGVGIPDGAHDKIFEDGYSTGEGGTGLGLRIVSEIAAAHGWTVSATESETGGARIDITGVESASGDEVEP